LSFYGKRPGTGLKLDKLSLQFALHETGRTADVLPGSWGPNAIHQLVAPHAWRLPFERAWRTSPDA